MRRSFRMGLMSVGYLALWAAGCTGEEVSVGSEAGQGLNRCFGVEGGCSANIATTPMADSEAHTCPEQASARLEVEFEFNPTEHICPPLEFTPCTDAAGNEAVCLPEGSFCSASIDDAAPAPDGTIWITLNATGQGSKGEHLQALWLGHVGAQGEKLSMFKLATGTALRDNAVYYETDIAVDARSHAFIAVYALDPGPNADAEVRQNTWLAHYDAMGQPVDGVIDLPGVARTFIAILDDGRIALAGDALHGEKRAIAAVLEPNGALQWSQPKLANAGQNAVGVSGVGVSGEGRVIVYTRRPATKNWDSRFGAFSFDGDGRLEWDVVVPKAIDPAMFPGFGVDRAGNFTSLQFLASGNARDIAEQTWIVNVDPAGEPRWSYQLDTSGPLSSALSVHRESGEVYYRDKDDLLRFSAEGGCERWSLGNGWHAGTVERGSDGNYFYFDANVVGRYRPPAEE